MKKTKFISLTLSLALVITALLSVNMISAFADTVKVTYDFDTTTPTFTVVGDVAGAEVIDANASFNTTKALKVWSTKWHNNSMSQSCVTVDIDASGASDITFDAGMTGWSEVEAHYGIVYNGDIYWDTTADAGNIYCKQHDGVSYQKNAYGNYSIVEHGNFYKFTGNFASAEDTERLTITSSNVSNITGLAFKRMEHSEGGHLLVDNITVYEAASYDTTVDVSMVAGASIRIGANNGIRYITNVDADKIAELESNGYTVDKGTLIAPADLLGSDELTFDLDSSKFVDVPTSGYYKDNQIAGSIKVNLNKNIAREFVGRGYVKVSKDGVEVATYYATLNDNTRSLKTLANSWIDDPESFALLNDDQKVEITTWANA